MNAVVSKDGTKIAYEKKGSGKPVILVDGALTYRSFGPMPGLAGLLAPYFTVYTYDRRGRGESSNTKPYAVEREVEDIEALIQEAGGGAFVYGISSGACLALEAAIKLDDKIKKLALYEPPYITEKAAQQDWKEYTKQIVELLKANRRGDAVVRFMQFVRTPTEQIEGMRQSPMWSIFEAVAPTLVYDAAVMGEDRMAPVKRVANIKIPAMVMDGGANLMDRSFMHQSATALAKAMPHAQQRTLEGQTHDVNLEVLTPVLVEFFSKH